ncbi:MAG TPA: alpha/beta hydrolase, partial [Nocardioidaceae bacterium]|nr:alpha/beta hydrolase [Nocardioidaceae bacterium]
AQAGRSAVAVDLPGFGEADDLADGAILPQLDRFVAALADAHGNGVGVVLVGNSLGGLAALRAAGRGVPALGVVTFSQPACGDSWLIRRFLAPRTSLIVRLLTLPVPVPRGLSAGLITVGARAALGRRAQVHDPAAARRIGEYFGRRRGGHVWAVRTSRRLGLESVGCYELDRVTCPVLVVHGQRDRIIPTNAARAVHAALPDSTLVLRQRWGHCPQLQDPEGVAAMIVHFLDEDVSTTHGDRTG